RQLEVPPRTEHADRRRLDEHLVALGVLELELAAKPAGLIELQPLPPGQREVEPLAPESPRHRADRLAVELQDMRRRATAFGPRHFSGPPIRGPARTTPASRAVRQSLRSSGKSPALDSTMRAATRDPGGRAVSSGSSARTVPAPMMIASIRPRNSCTRRRDSS